MEMIIGLLGWYLVITYGALEIWDMIKAWPTTRKEMYASYKLCKISMYLAKTTFQFSSEYIHRGLENYQELPRYIALEEASKICKQAVKQLRGE